MLYRITLWVPEKFDRALTPVKSEIVSTRRAAELTAKGWLPTAYETSYSARTTRQPCVYVQAVKRVKVGPGQPSQYVTLGRSYSIETPIHYVPSVGELGYSP